MEESGKKKGVRKWSQESTIVREDPGRKAQEERRVSTESARHGHLSTVRCLISDVEAGSVPHPMAMLLQLRKAG